VPDSLRRVFYCRFDSIYDRHLHVHGYEVEFLLRQHMERRGAVVHYHRVPHFFEDSRDEPLIHDVVFRQAKFEVRCQPPPSPWLSKTGRQSKE
jgi:hypothetical protein